MDYKPGNKLKLGVMGFPVRQSRSPELFYKTFEGRADVLDRFSYDILEEDTFENAFERFQRDYYAVNVTIPYKEYAFKAADEASPQSRAIGAVNLLIHQDGRVVAHNTDVLAVTEILNQWFHEQNGLFCSAEGSKIGSRKQNIADYSSGPKVLVVGCGGAGKAATAAALSVGTSVTIINRTPDTALRFIGRLQTNLPNFVSEAEFRTGRPAYSTSGERSVRYAPLRELPVEVRRADFIIYALPLAVPEIGHCDFTGKTLLEAKYYDPSIKQVPGMKYIPGTEWLRLQAVETYVILGLI